VAGVSQPPRRDGPVLRKLQGEERSKILYFTWDISPEKEGEFILPNLRKLKCLFALVSQTQFEKAKRIKFNETTTNEARKVKWQNFFSKQLKNSACF